MSSALSKRVARSALCKVPPAKLARVACSSTGDHPELDLLLTGWPLTPPASIPNPLGIRSISAAFHGSLLKFWDEHIIDGFETTGISLAEFGIWHASKPEEENYIVSFTLVSWEKSKL